MSRNQLEQIVRPFQLPAVSYPVRIFDDNPKVVEDPVLEFGKDGSTKVFNESFSQSISTYKDAEIKEQSREVTKKRIENPDDPSQYVDVELIKKLTTEQGKGKDYKKSTYQFNND
jgi:hypothetical protein